MLAWFPSPRILENARRCYSTTQASISAQHPPLPEFRSSPERRIIHIRQHASSTARVEEGASPATAKVTLKLTVDSTLRSAFSSSSTEAARSWVFCAAMTYVLPSLLQGCHILTYSIGIPQHCPGRRVRREGWRREGPHWHGCHSWKRCRHARSARPHQPGRSQDRPINLKYPQAHAPSAAIETRPKRRREAIQ